MAIRELYLGSVGPLLYDDADVYDGTIIPMKGVYTTGKMRAGTAPTNNDEVVRLQDLTGILTIIPGVDVVTGARAIGVVYQNAETTMIRAGISIAFEPSGGSELSDWVEAPEKPITIAGGVITATGTYTRIDTEAAAATDDLDTITAGAAYKGKFIILQAADGTHDVVVKHGTGNIYLDGGVDVTLDALRDRLLLHCDGSWWCAVSPDSNNG